MVNENSTTPNAPDEDAFLTSLRIAGKTAEDIRVLVVKLEAARKAADRQTPLTESA